MIQVLSVGKGWVPKDKPEADPLYTIVIKGEGEPQKTYDKALAEVGEHEAEKFTSKTGKEYWRTPKDAQNAPAQATERPKWEPRDDSAIRAQWAIGRAVELALSVEEKMDSHIQMNLVEAKANYLFAMVDRVKSPVQDTVRDAGDFKIINEVFDGNEPVREYQGD